MYYSFDPELGIHNNCEDTEEFLTIHYNCEDAEEFSNNDFQQNLSIGSIEVEVIKNEHEIIE